MAPLTPTLVPSYEQPARDRYSRRLLGEKNYRLVADDAGTLARADGRDHSLLGKVEVKF